MKHIIICILALCLAVQVNAQSADQKNKRVKYRGFAEVGCGLAYNLNTAQTVSTLNMQALWSISTSHGINYKGLFGGLGLGYNHSQRDKENMYLFFGDLRYSFDKCKVAPSIGLKGGIIYDPNWIETVQKYIALNTSVKVWKGLRVGLEGSVFSRPARHFTANGLAVISYEFGK